MLTFKLSHLVFLKFDFVDSKALWKQNNTIEGTGSSLLNVPSFNRSVNLIGQRSPSIDQMIENNGMIIQFLNNEWADRNKTNRFKED